MPKISQYPRVTALTGTELVPMDSGTSPNYTTVTATTNTLAAAIASGVGIFNTSHAGVVPASPGGTSTTLAASGTWTATFTGTWTFPKLISLVGISGTATAANNLRGTATFSSATTVAVTFGVSEPDTSYQVALGGNAAGYCWVTSKATGGFTINCSASNSNPTDWFLIR
jgi:hypothetical protein